MVSSSLQQNDNRMAAAIGGMVALENSQWLLKLEDENQAFSYITSIETNRHHLSSDTMH